MTGPRSPLERRYRRLLRAYPARYRIERGEELVGTFLDLAGPQQRRPSLADTLDVLAGGLRQRLRGSRAAGVAAGVPLAAPLALCATVGLAAYWLLWLELRPVPADVVATRFGPFQSVGAVAWSGWLVAAVAAAVLPARTARWTILAALAATLAPIPVAALAAYDRPPLLVLVPQVALGAVAAGWPGRPGWTVRLAPAAVVVAAAVAAVSPAPGSARYLPAGHDVLMICAGALLAGSLATAAVRALALRPGGGWAVLILLPAVALLLVEPVTTALAEATGRATPGWSEYAAAAAGITGLAAAGLLLAASLPGRRGHRREPGRWTPGPPAARAGG